MTQKSADLSMLSRGHSAPDHAAARTQVPSPRSRWKTRVALPALIVTATVVTLTCAAGAALWPATDVRVVPVLLKTGSQGAAVGAVTVQAPGWVEPDPFGSAVSALADGVVEQVLALEGESVHAGQVVARLVDEDARLALAGTESECAARQAAWRAAEAVLQAAERDWEHPIELTRRLATAEARLAEAQAELRRWPADLAAAEALEIELEADYQRVAALYERTQESEIEFIRARQQHEVQRQIVQATRIREQTITAQIQRLEAEVLAAREDLRLRIADTRALDEARATVAGAQAALQRAEVARDEATLRLARMEVRAPTDGVVMTRLAEPGTKLMLGADNPRSAHVLRLYDPQKLQVRVDVPLVDAAKVGVGQAAEVVVDVLPERVYRGHVTRVVNEADIQKNTLQLKVAIADPTPELKPEMLARVRFLADAPDQASPGRQRVFVPEALVQRGAGGHTYVWLADQAGNVAVHRAVALGGARLNDWIEIDEGLQPGDRLIADPPADLRDGQRIRIIGETAAIPQ